MPQNLLTRSHEEPADPNVVQFLLSGIRTEQYFNLAEATVLIYNSGKWCEIQLKSSTDQGAGITMDKEVCNSGSSFDSCQWVDLSLGQIFLGTHSLPSVYLCNLRILLKRKPWNTVQLIYFAVRTRFMLFGKDFSEIAVYRTDTSDFSDPFAT